MKKKVIITSILVLIIGLIYILLYFKIVPNPFVNTNDLTCSRMNAGAKEEFVFKFNWLGKSIFSKKTSYIYFETEEKAQKYYDFYVETIPSVMEKEGKTIVIKSLDENEKENFGENRKKILENYTDYGFKCE